MTQSDEGDRAPSIAAWLRAHVTDDPRALAWFADPESEPRIQRAFRELLSGYAVDPASVLKTTRVLEAGERRGVVTVHDVRFYSLCAHHFLPFFGRASVSYLPGDRILGLGKLPRLVDVLSRRFCIQEDLTREIAEALIEHGGARGARVITEAQHLCMCARGPSQPESTTRVEIALGELSP
ncbi:MAG: GTP cyclohydrolase [Myxococcales bacterium]|jgi:GTP cyclohydrolase I|nr:GTP cyclohydrolase [Myxococcales bacterium]